MYGKITMSRINLFEFEDFSCTPKIIRDATTDFLHTYINVSKIYNCIFEDIVKTLEETNNSKIIDLCSGGGGPCNLLTHYIINESNLGNKFESITLTDLYPNSGAFSSLNSKNKKIKAIDYSVDATNVPTELKGMRTLFTSFHHMSPTVAKSILKNCVDSGEPIGIFEYTERSFFSLFIMIFFAPILVFILILFSKPFSFKKILITPIATLTTWWDGIASCLRTYSIKELKGFTDEIDPDKTYKWQIGKKFSFRNLSNVTYLIGKKN
jgi:hypothetical protein